MKRNLLLVATGVIVAIAVLAALSAFFFWGCGGEDAISGSESGDDAQVVPGGPAEGELKFANWPLYVDPGRDGTTTSNAGPS